MSTNQNALLRCTLPFVVAAIFPAAAYACATCGCSLSTDAAMGYSAAPGWRINIEYDFINQNQLRSGTGSVSNTQPAGINDAGGSQEVERLTINRYINLGISYSPSASWNFSALIPYIYRSHTTYGNATTDQLTPDNVSGATSKGLGDIKLIASYQGFLPTHNLGLQLVSSYPPADTVVRMSIQVQPLGTIRCSSRMAPSGCGPGARHQLATRHRQY